MTTKEFLGAMTRERDRFELDMGDSLDVKASIVLLILTFLGTITAMMLTTESVTRIPKLSQIPVIVCLVVSGLFCVACLWPKDYLIDDLPVAYASWAASLSKVEPERFEYVASFSFQRANGRIKHNHALNETKAWALNGAFWSMSIGLLVELVAVTYIAFSIRPS